MKIFKPSQTVRVHQPRAEADRRVGDALTAAAHSAPGVDIRIRVVTAAFDRTDFEIKSWSPEARAAAAKALLG